MIQQNYYSFPEANYEQVMIWGKNSEIKYWAQFELIKVAIQHQ